jgi:CMP-N,N'-diacetyllegionaminic acid synthase
MECLALITARAGSKGIPGKNMFPLAGKPLLGYSIDAARASTRVTRCILSSDGPDAIAYAKKQGVEVPFTRPAALAADQSTHVDVVWHALDYLARNERYHPQWVVVLQPTSPLRTAADIDACVELAVARNVHSVISVTEAHPHPWLAQTVAPDGTMKPFFENLPKVSRRQDFPLCYVPNGAVYVLDVAEFNAQKSLYMNRTFAYIMPQDRSVDIDTMLDMKLAELLLTGRT